MHLKSPLAIAESDNATQKVTNNFEKDIISRQYAHLIDKRIVSMMPNTSGAALQNPSILTFLSLTSGKRHRAHSFGMRPTCHKHHKDIKRKSEYYNHYFEFF